MLPTQLRQDRILAPLFEQLELPPLLPTEDVYGRLQRAIIYQQLSGKAATTIYNRFIALFPGGYPEPTEVVKLDEPTLRGVGLSKQKSGYVHNVAVFFEEHALIGTDWARYQDEEIIQLLTQIKGVGEWTVQMILIAALNRPDVWPTKDLAIQQAMQALYQLDGRGRHLEKQMIAAAEKWRPHRTLVARYLWRWRDTVV